MRRLIGSCAISHLPHVISLTRCRCLLNGRTHRENTFRHAVRKESTHWQIMCIALVKPTALFVSPTRVAQLFDWNKSRSSLLTVSIQKDRIDAMVVYHPDVAPPESSSRNSTVPLKFKVSLSTSSALNISHGLRQDFLDLAQQYRVCGMVVAWPMQREGRCGYSCGRVLYTLDQLAWQGHVCLYNAEQAHAYDENECREDEWGRSALYGKIPSPDRTIQLASKEQYTVPTHSCRRLWQDFRLRHWPNTVQSDESSRRGFANVQLPWRGKGMDDIAFL